MRRVAVVGPGGAGKSTFAKELGRRLALRVVHLDEHYWKPGWVESSKDEWRRVQGELIAGERWIVDGNYGGTFDVRLPERTPSSSSPQGGWPVSSARSPAHSRTGVPRSRPLAVRSGSISTFFVGSGATRSTVARASMLPSSDMAIICWSGAAFAARVSRVPRSAPLGGGLTRRRRTRFHSASEAGRGVHDRSVTMEQEGASRSKGPRLLDPDFLLNAALGGAMLAVAEHVPLSPMKPMTAVSPEDFSALITAGSRRGLKSAVEALRSSSQHLQHQTDQIEEALDAEG